MLDAEGFALRSELSGWFQARVDQPRGDEEFNRLALRIFDYQFRHCRPYAAYCRRRELTPDMVDNWAQIPPVPAEAFKELPLTTGDPDAAEAVFLTSGTTLGPERRGRHFVMDLSIYHAALLPAFSAYILPDSAELPFLSLVPHARELPDSSLAHMVTVVTDRLGGHESGFFASTAEGLDHERLDQALARHESEGRAVCLIGTALAFVHWFDRLRRSRRTFRLPPGSRIMDTGGFKGAQRQVPAAELRRAYGELLGVPDDHCINEYGMTEMCSQFYDDALRNRVLKASSGPTRVKRAPPWLRTRVVSPETLEPVADQETGILQHFDLANLASVIAIQTEDLGRRNGDGFEISGRITGGSPRGCSIAMDLLLNAARSI